VQAVVSDHPYPVFGIVGFPNNGGLVAHFFQMPVNAIFGDVEFSVEKPLYARLFEIPLQYFVPFFAPLKRFRHSTPEFLGLANTPFISCFVFVKRLDLKRVSHNSILGYKLRQNSLLKTCAGNTTQDSARGKRSCENELTVIYPANVLL
jgi:hypothetical protein